MTGSNRRLCGYTRDLHVEQPDALPTELIFLSSMVGFTTNYIINSSLQVLDRYI